MDGSVRWVEETEPGVCYQLKVHLLRILTSCGGIGRCTNSSAEGPKTEKESILTELEGSRREA